MGLPSQLDCQLLKQGSVFLMFIPLPLAVAMFQSRHIVDAQLTFISMNAWMHTAWVVNMVHKSPFTTILLEIPSIIRFYWFLLKKKENFISI